VKNLEFYPFNIMKMRDNIRKMIPYPCQVGLTEVTFWLIVQVPNKISIRTVILENMRD